MIQVGESDVRLTGDVIKVKIEPEDSTFDVQVCEKLLLLLESEGLHHGSESKGMISKSSLGVFPHVIA